MGNPALMEVNTMSAGIDFSTGRAAIAYAGQTPWHRWGTPAKADWTLEQWIVAAGLGYTAERVPVYIPYHDRQGGFRPVDGAYINIRSDTGAILGTQTHTERRVEVQPREIVEFIHRYVATDDRFHMQVMGALWGGAQMWATASFQPNGADGVTVGGSQLRPYLLGRTAFDGSLATILQMTTIEVVCANTAAMAYADKSAFLSIKHTTRFDARAAAANLARMAQAVDRYKAIGDALAANHMAEKEVVDLFRHLLDIPANAGSKDISTRKLNQYNQLVGAYSTSLAERGQEKSAYTALQAVTRYADHDRSVRGDSDMSEDQKRFLSSQFGSGDAFKGRAMAFLLPRVRDKVLVPA